MSRQASGDAGGAGSGTNSHCAWQPTAGSSIGAAAVSEHALLLFCTGTRRQLVVLLPAAAAASAPKLEQLQQQQQLPQLLLAAQLPMGAEVSCISNLLLLPQPAQQQQQRSAVFAVGTYASTVLLLQLMWDPQQPQKQASLGLLQVVDLTASSIASSLPTASAAAAAGVPGATPLSPRTLQREQLTPESLLLLPPDGGGCASSSSSAAASLVVGLRTGGMLQLRCCWGEQQPQQLQRQQELLSLSVGNMPVELLPLPEQQQPAALAAAGVVPAAAVALSDRVSVLHHPSAAAGGGRVRCQPLALPKVQAAAALLLDSGSLGGSSFMLDVVAAAYELQQQQPGGAAAAVVGQQQLFLLCAAADGCLRMVSLEPPQLASSRCWPLPQGLQPSCLAVHAASGGVAVAGRAPLSAQQRRRWQREQQGWEEAGEEPVDAATVQLLDPATGRVARLAWEQPQSVKPGLSHSQLALLHSKQL